MLSDSQKYRRDQFRTFLSLSVLKTITKLNMPKPDIVHPIKMAKGPAVTAVFCGKENAPAPMTLPTTSSTSSPKPSSGNIG